APPAFAQLGGGRRLGHHDAAAVGMPPQHLGLAETSRIARVADGEEPRETRRSCPVALRREPGDAQGGEQRVVPRRQRRLQPRIDAPRAPPPRGGNRHDVVAGRCDAGRSGPHDPLPRAPAAMALSAHITRDVEESPAGPAVGAFFDVDGTLIAGFSAVAFLRDRLLSGRMSPRDVAATVLNSVGFQLGRVGFSGLIAATAGWLRGVPEKELEELAERIFARTIAAAIYPESRTLV